MQWRTVHSDRSRPVTDLRNNAYVIGQSKPSFDASYLADFMTTTEDCRTAITIPSVNRPPKDCPQVLDFVGCSYLGLDNHPVVIAEAIEAQQSLYLSSARARLALDLLRALEEDLSELFSARVLVFSSGMLANLGAMPILASGRLTGGTKPLLIFDSSAHISLGYHKPVVADVTRVETIPHNDLRSLERLCRENAVVAYVCDDLCSMAGSSPLEGLRQLQERYGLFLYIDDAHSISIVGHHGEGFARSRFSQVLGERTIIAGSLAKGFGASGGLLMLGTTRQEALFRQHCVPYALSSPLNLAAVGAALGSCKIHRSAELGERQRRIAERIKVFDHRIATAEHGSLLPIRMISAGSETNAIAIARTLLNRGFHTQATFLPKTAPGTASIRVRITAEHELGNIEQLCDCILDTVAATTGKPYPLR
ncbi:aminotransferase class I/II-fold pyridoxal phosphate-dependent enzyme [Bradyrhizobium sp. WSM471]|uniref:aminotransferase class I/II-fold pyridoxal phosphate-dependent enzyme n=1 Tax=Bradyrhizobium sp. WSM471 TaxID=319017 RepID=UPI00024D235B|nr:MULTISPECIES: aminotransferase class I/II-fold pyridoxal phosphate-dependent enzyme [Bradyrhizobium]EHR00845.1 7-keto-8-aminopelargonate synthetase-like enzyme [Bradyrhizobium sp. WSM471]UFW42924.1 aminotransferase class I/II-fold pyridoxal phosphate-dependent enzyme [Bradyrhizobium canariense]